MKKFEFLIRENSSNLASEDVQNGDRMQKNKQMLHKVYSYDNERFTEEFVHMRLAKEYSVDKMIIRRKWRIARKDAPLSIEGIMVKKI